jgi:hypothetical protein
MKIGDLVMTRRGNLALITGTESCGIYIDVLFCNTGYHKTGWHCSNILRVIKK